MRHVSRLARKTRAGIRRPAPRRWVQMLRRTGLVVVGLGLLGYLSDKAWQAPLTARLIDQGTDRLVDASAAAGFVVGRVFSEGRNLADEQKLLKALEPVYGRPILAVDLDELRERVERIPWVRSASVGRELPDTLWVRLDEYRPIARWLDGNRQVLVSEAGEVVRNASPERFRGLPLLFGDGAPARADELLRLVATQPALAERVTGARLVGGRRWDVHLDGRIEVRLPADRPEAAWRRLAQEEAQSDVLGRAIAAVDLRHPDWLTLRIADQAVRRGTEPGA